MKNIATIFLAAIVLSCTNSDASKGTALPHKSSVIGAGTKIIVELTGGPNAGKYSANSEEPTCSMGYTGANSFGNQYSVEGKGPKELSSLQLIVNNYDSAKAGTNQFMVTVGFGKLGEDNSYTIAGIDDNPKKGIGKLTIKESGNEKVVSIEGETEDVL